MLVTQVGADEVGGVEREQQVRRVLTDAGLLEAGLKSHRVLFCSSVKGRVAIIVTCSRHWLSIVMPR